MKMNIRESKVNTGIKTAETWIARNALIFPIINFVSFCNMIFEIISPTHEITIQRVFRFDKQRSDF